MFETKKAVREGMPALVAFWGPSNSGKTLTSLLVARGLVGPDGNIFVIDTENKRAKVYAERVGGWTHMDFQPPFSPERYTAAIDQCVDEGADVVIIDSASHVWEGEGGVLDAAAKLESNGKKGAQVWKAPKMAHKRMMNHMLRSPVHVIFCFRAKDGMDWRSKTPRHLGVTPICGDDFVYEMTLSFLLGSDHKPVLNGGNDLLSCNPLIPSVKAPEELMHVMGIGECMNEDSGVAIRKWIDGAAAFNFDVSKLQQEARDLASFGRERFAEWWKTLDQEKRKSLKSIFEDLGSIADQADSEAASDPEASAPTNGDVLDDKPPAGDWPGPDPAGED